MRRTCWFAMAALGCLVGAPLAARANGEMEALLLTQATSPPTPIPVPPPSPFLPGQARTVTPRGDSDQGLLALARLNPHMIGELAARGYIQRVLVVQPGSVRIVPGVPNPNLPGRPVPPQVIVIPPVTKTIYEPIVSAGAFKIAENESPRPVDRVFATYNHFNTVNTFGGRDFDLHRGVFGFEKTFLDGDASFGVRAPVMDRSNETTSNPVNGFGDLSLILKFAAINDAETGDVLSGGLVVTIPTGRDVRLQDNRRLDSTLIQPWVGFIANAGRAYVHGFSSVVLPTESRDVTILSNDLGVGYRLYENSGEGLVSFVTPTIEGHLFTPLSNRSHTDTLRSWDIFTLTAGAHIGLGRNAVLTVGAGVPLTGPRPFDCEAVVQFNLRF